LLVRLIGFDDWDLGIGLETFACTSVASAKLFGLLEEEKMTIVQQQQ